jgi:serine/threonine protein kinase
MEGCLDEAGLIDFFERRMDPEARSAVDRHIDTCPACRNLIATLAIVQSGELHGRAADHTAHDPTLDPVDALSAGDVIAGRFRLERVVGEGGMGVVWAATEIAGGGPRALKILKTSDRAHSRRFLREARLPAALRHPNIVDVHELLELPASGRLVMVMDLLAGESLSHTLRQEGRLHLGEVVRILLALTSALAAAHALGVVHRDLKPQNVFLATPRAAGAPADVMLLDFGMAKLTATDGDAAQTGSGITESGAILGTPHYMAPEQVYGEKQVDPLADVWAIGVIAYECLSGRRPVEGKSFGQIFRNMTLRSIEPLGSLVAGLPREVTSLVDRMLSHDRAGRPTAAEVNRELSRLKAGSSLSTSTR